MKTGKPKITVMGLYGLSMFMGVKSFPQAGETVTSQEYFLEPGGKGFNQAVAAARLGASVCFVAAVGKDFIGRKCREFLEKEGITEHFVKECSLPTAAAAISYDAEGSSRVIVYPGASHCLSSEDIFRAREAIAQSDFLLLQNELPVETLHAAVDLAVKVNTQVILDPAPVVDFDTDLLGDVYLVTPNEVEAAAIAELEAGNEPWKLAQMIHHKGAQRVLITLGEKGVLISDQNKITRLNALDTHVVDTTGAGDTFNGALAVALARGFDLINAAHYAVVASGLAVKKRGVLRSIPKTKAMDMVLKNLERKITVKRKSDTKQI